MGQKANSGMEKLAILTATLPEIVGAIQPGFVEYNMDVGTCIGFFLYNKPEVAVQRAFLTKGSKFPVHAHAETEIIIVYRGEFSTKQDDDPSIILHPGNVIVYLPNELHSHEALEDSWVISITIPSAEGYPKDGNG